MPNPLSLTAPPDEVSAALRSLSKALTHLADPLHPALGRVTEQDLLTTLQAMQQTERTHALQALGIAVPATSVNLPMCRDMLTRMRRAPDSTRTRHALRHLSGRVKPALIHASHQAEPHALADTPPWTHGMLRLCLWAHATADIDDARVWAWALQLDWMTSDLDPAAVSKIAAAAEAVLALAPHRVHPGEDTPPARRSEVLEPVDEQVSPSRATVPAPRPAPADADPGDPADLRTLLAALQVTVSTTQPPAERIASAIRDGARPLDADLAALQRLVHDFDEALELFSDLGLGTPRARIADLESAAEKAEEQAGTQAAEELVRTDLAAVADLRAPEGSPAFDLLPVAQQLGRDLLASTAWTEELRTRADALAALPRLIALVGSEATDTGQMLALQSTLVQGLPELTTLAFNFDIIVLAPTPQPCATPTGVKSTGAGTPAPPGALTEAVLKDPPQATSTPDPATPPARTGRPEQPEQPQQPQQPPAMVARPVRTESPGHHPGEENHTGRPTGGAHNTPDPDDLATATIASLLPSERYGLAYHVAAVADWSAQRQAALRIAAYAHGIRTEAGGCAAALAEEMTGLDVEAVAVDWPAAALVVPAIIRTCLVSGEYTAGARLHELAPRLEDNLGTIASEIARRVLSGALVECPPLNVVEDVATLERDLARAQDACRAALRKPARSRFPRAEQIARQLLADDGLLGSVFQHVIADDRDSIPEVVRSLQRIRRLTVVQSELGRLDAEINSSGKPLQGKARQELIRLVEVRARPVEQWVIAARSLSRPRSQDLSRNTGEVEAMRRTVLQRRSAVLAALSSRAEQGSDTLARAAALGADASMRHTFALLEGSERLPELELPLGLVLDAELLKLPGVSTEAESDRITRPAVSVRELTAAADRSWAHSVREQVLAERFDAVDHLILCTEQGLLREPDGTRAVVPEEVRKEAKETQLQISRDLTARHEELNGELRHARLDNSVSQEQEWNLDRRLQAAAPERPELAVVRAELDSIAAELTRLRELHEAGLRSRLDAVEDTDPVDRDRVGAVLAERQFSTAEEMISQLESGEGIPQIGEEQRELDRFFPAVPQALSSGITDELIKAVRSRRRHRGLPELDYSALSEENAERAAAALQSWSVMGSRSGGQRQEGLREQESLTPALRLIGYSSLRRPQRRDDLRKGPDYRFLDLPDVRLTGRAQVPAFGSDLGPNLRIMLVWGQPAPERLLSYAEHDGARDSLLIAYFGTMSAKDRAALAVRTVGHRPIVVLDDAALAYLAAHGNGRLDAAMNILVPFSGINPYISEKRGRVADEMFFGRHKELHGLTGPSGTQVVFGGRGLGKSALLKAAGQFFEKQDAAHRISLLISLDGVHFGGAATSSAVWHEIGRKLDTRGVKAKRRSRSVPAFAFDQVRDAIEAWQLREDPQHQLLILLDEADRFFEADAPGFLETRRLRDLGQDSNGRVKAVFAGLHSVQRFAKVAGNSPFSHLAQKPTVVGPLFPQDAANLLSKPLSVLGYEFEDVNLVHRILGYCSYQPFLLQMFGHRLVEVMHRRRADGQDAGIPPYRITRNDVQAVHSDPALQQKITSAFRDTLLLDHRYNVIANVLAQHAHDHGMHSRLTQAELRDLCRYYWPTGFRSLDAEAFRAYLAEMEGLGVLGPDTGMGWHLRSTNALRMIGTRSEVEDQLTSAESESMPEEFASLEARPALADGSYAPLTTRQVADVLGHHGSQVRVVLGTDATGIRQADSALRILTEKAGGWTVPAVRGRGDFQRELVDGKAEEKRAILSDLTARAPQDTACLESLQEALCDLPADPRVTRSAVLMAGPQQIALWQSALVTPSREPSFGVIVLRRYTRQGLRLWALDQQRFTDEDHLGQLGTMTGGWPILLDRVSAHLKEGLSSKRALSKAAETLDDPQGCADFVRSVGLADQPDLAAAYRSVHSYMEPGGLEYADLIAAAEDDRGREQAETAIACLDAMQVFERLSPDLFGLESVLSNCWLRTESV
ncbi:hypothetical protein J2S46_000138 [Kitasatospora herbaricolor]|uniref:AAA family ATPase n=1 Tax=Kitasatospora herbaricolor TaxID=68217 RepID=UPI00174ECD32|nr:AAA family ATPase [Kitasatospora herbaricolor]MDQ0305582.1 hypothetical protein [Kitasatospora herbaricolor]